MVYTMPSIRVQQFCHKNNGNFFFVFGFLISALQNVDFSASGPTNLFLKHNKLLFLEDSLGIDLRLEYTWEVQYVIL